MIANRNTFLFVLVLLISGCMHYTLVEPGKTDIGTRYSVHPQIAWNKSTYGKIEIWTIDGPTLDAIHFFKGIADGETLFPSARSQYNNIQEERLPKFRKDMNPNEVLEFIVDSMITSGVQSPIGPSMKGTDVQTLYLRPFSFGNQPGYRFEFSFISDNGLEYKGLAAGAIIDDKLHLICYTGTKEYYYFKHRPHAEEIISSIDMP